MIGKLEPAARAVWDFVVGDDSITALGVVVAAGVTAVLESAGVAAWWVIPAAVLALLTRSVTRRQPAPSPIRSPADPEDVGAGGPGDPTRRENT